MDKREKYNTPDRISDLPEVIIHHIMSFLQPAEIKRTSVLSKRWQHMGFTFPILEFSNKKPGFYIHNNKFFCPANQSLSRFIQHNNNGRRIQKFSLSVAFTDSQIVSRFEKLIQRVVDCDVEELELSTYTDLELGYNLPNQTILAAKSLRVLKLKEDNRRFKLSNNSREFKFLQTLSACETLKVLSLQDMNIEDSLFHEFVSKFPLLEELEVIGCDMLERIKISSHHLKHLTLQDCGDLVRVDLDAPNLISLLYEGGLGTLFSSTSASSGKWEFTLISSQQDDNGTSWFLKLKEFLSRSYQIKAVTFCTSSCMNSMRVEELQDIPLPQARELECLKLFIGQSSSSNPHFFDAFFWSCRPNILSITFRTWDSAKFVRWLCKELLCCQEYSGCCNFRCSKCWRHYLEDVKVEGFNGIEDEKLNEFLDTWWRTPSRVLHFRFKWGHKCREIEHLEGR